MGSVRQPILISRAVVEESSTLIVSAESDVRSVVRERSRLALLLVTLGALVTLAALCFLAAPLLQQRGRPAFAEAPDHATLGLVIVAESQEASQNMFDSVAKKIVLKVEHGYWQVVVDSANVGDSTDSSANILSTKERCSVVAGVDEDGDRQWIRLESELGYLKQWTTSSNESVKKLEFTQLVAPGETCYDHGLFPIVTLDVCQAAVNESGLENTSVQVSSVASVPEGCVVLNQSFAIFSASDISPLSAGSSTYVATQLICSNLKPCTPPTTTSTTLSTTTMTTTTITFIFESPSLFCFMVAMSQGYEVDLIRFQKEHNAGIFDCDEHLVMTDKSMQIGTSDDLENTTAIGSLKCERGSWGSWINAPNLVKAWQAVATDGRYLRHDWVVKLDADTVFFPFRLKWHVKDIPEGDLSWYQNFYDGYPVVGAIELASKEAVTLLSKRQSECDEWAHESAEDDWFVKCMRLIGVNQRKDDQLLQHEQHPKGDMCLSGWFVAIHPFKTVDEYKACMDRSPPRP